MNPAYKPITKRNRGFSFKGFFYSKKLAPYIFVSPFILSFFIFFLYPTIATFTMSFQEVLGLNNARFIGLDNYSRLFNEHFYNALETNTIYTAITIMVLIPIPIIFAVLLNSTLMKARSFFKSIIFIPALTSVIVAGVSFRLMFGELDTALINSVFIQLGLTPQKWNMNYGTGLMLMVILTAWRYAGINMVYYLAGLQSIPEELYESAEIDGANAFTKLYYITLPLLKPIIIYTLTIAIFDGYRMFGESFVFWNEGMPGDIGLTIVRYIYQQAFQRNDMGFGSAIGITLLMIVLAINLVQLKLFGLFKKEAD
ncbi:carbohydrate ABC transporter permease [Paenibacillus agricola]|uniref:carbohydrate ABC transporter permease n=1 Tax=Paenibacillus agricola TaxID=2716264 RepID=UPI0035D47526